MNNALLHLLRNGGYILYARHGEATVGEDWPNLSFQYCYTQRNLSDYGRQQAIYYGQILRFLRIPISYPVLASPFCRAIETAQLAFGTQSLQIDPFWLDVYRLGEGLSLFEQNRILDTLEARLESIPPQGMNAVIVAHSFPNGVGLGQIPDMGTVIIKPLGRKKGYRIIGRLSLADFEG